MSLMDMLVAESVEDTKKNQKKEKSVKPKQQEEKPVKATTKQDTEKKSGKKYTAKGNKKYRFPFRLQYANQYLDLNGIFEEGQDYTKGEICELMLQHGYFSFSAEQTAFDYRIEENVLVAYGKQYKKG